VAAPNGTMPAGKPDMAKSDDPVVCQPSSLKIRLFVPPVTGNW